MKRITCKKCNQYWDIPDDVDILKQYGKNPVCWNCLINMHKGKITLQ